MTDNEIIKALKECEECHYYNECEKSTRLALDLINRQKAEIERLTAKYRHLDAEMGKMQMTAKAEAIKEFAERLKEKTAYLFSAVSIRNEVDNLVKEMVGDE